MITIKMIDEQIKQNDYLLEVFGLKDKGENKGDKIFRNRTYNGGN